MQWHKVKTALIVLFLLLNIFLMSIIYSSYRREKRYEDESTAAAIALLENRGIFLQAEIPRRVKTMPRLRLTSPETRFGEKNMAFVFEDTDKQAESINLRTAQRLLNAAGINTNGANRQLEPPYVKITNAYEGYPIFDTGITVGISGDEICYLKGRWLDCTKEGSETPVKPFHTILVNHLQNPDRPRGEPSYITEVSFGYSMLSAAEEQDFVEGEAYPVCRIATQDGNVYYYKM